MMETDTSFEGETVSLGWKIMSAGAAALTAIAAGKVAEIGWKVATGTDVPNDEFGDDNVVAVVLFAAVSAAAVAYAQHYATRGAHSLYAARSNRPELTQE